MALISTQDDERIKALKAQYATATASGDVTGANTAHSAAEAIRKQYGYSGGSSGADYVPLSNAGATKTAIPTSTSQSDYLNQLYAAKKAASVASLTSAYEQNVSTLNSQAAKIPQTYATAKNATASSAAVNQANFDERAAANGINSGAGTQIGLANSNALTTGLSALDSQQANALTDIETKRTELSTQYKNAIAQAQAENDTAKAQSLYEEAVRVDNDLVSQAQAQAAADSDYRSQLETKAETLAQYGNFSGYLALGYTSEQVAQMQKVYEAAQKKTSSGSGTYSGGTSAAAVDSAPVVEFNSTTIDETSPYGVITDIGDLRSQGFTSAQIKANAKSAYDAGQITASQYQMYVQYAGKD